MAGENEFDPYKDLVTLVTRGTFFAGYCLRGIQ
jgi:hypothetical protein